MKKTIFSSIICGVTLAVSFVLTKTLMSKTILKSKKKNKILKNFGTTFRLATKRTHKKVENIPPKIFSKSVEHSFFIDYPKSSIEGSTSLICNNMVMVDSSSFAKAFSIETLYSREKHTLNLLYNDNVLTFNLDNRTTKFNNEQLEIEQYAIFANDLIFIPLPLTAELFGLNVKINNNDRIISITA